MHLLRAIILVGVVFSTAYVVGQDATKPDTAGSSVYSNDCLALGYRLPEGWNFAKIKQSNANHQTNKKMTLFKAQRSAVGPAESLEVDVMKPPLEHPNMERFTILLALSLVQADATKNKITRNAYPVTVAGRSFFRSDLSQGDRVLSLFATWYRGYAVIAWASADSPQDLDDAASALRALSFGEDKRSAECFDSTN